MKQEIIQFIQTDLLNNQVTLTEDQDLLISGLIDSMAVMRLVNFLETQVGSSIPPEDITLENFSSVSTIAQYVQDNFS